MVFGINQPATLKIMSSTFRSGDPSFAGPLAGIGLGLQSYHILELQEYIPEAVWSREMGIAELAIDDEKRQEILRIMAESRREVGR